jgi:hypothetical protein
MQLPKRHALQVSGWAIAPLKGLFCPLGLRQYAATVAHQP